jgi:putative colanic acid biosynthesis UDP-glucose lipid carrier transferase
MGNYYVRTAVKPGITGLAQVRGFRGETRTEADVIRRVESDISYLETWSLSLDLIILVRTCWQIVRPPNGAR